MSSREPEKCPVCETPLVDGRRHDQGSRIYFECPRCGLFGLARAAEIKLDTLLTDARKRAVLSYGIRQTPRQGLDTLLLDFEACKRIVDAGILPTPQEQADNLILWLGTSLPGPGDRIRAKFEMPAAKLGMQTREAYWFVLEGLMNAGLVQGDRYIDGSADITLTFAGWEHFEQLRRGTSRSRKAFMAMQYGVLLLDRLVNDHFRPAVAQTGFELRRLDDEQPAGLIDDRLRVEIQSARFLIADLTHDNRGAYWEAGYAEGLGKPVIYTCQESKFRQAVPHFDTNHHLTVLWNENAVAVAMEKLKATIRATIPEATRE